MDDGAEKPSELIDPLKRIEIWVNGDPDDVFWITYDRARQLARQYCFDSAEQFLEWMRTPSDQEMMERWDREILEEEEPPIEEEVEDEGEEVWNEGSTDSREYPGDS